MSEATYKVIFHHQGIKGDNPRVKAYVEGLFMAKYNEWAKAINEKVEDLNREWEQNNPGKMPKDDLIGYGEFMTKKYQDILNRVSDPLDQLWPYVFLNKDEWVPIIAARVSIAPKWIVYFELEEVKE